MTSQQAITSDLAGSSSAQDVAQTQGSSATKGGAKSSEQVTEGRSIASSATLAPAKYRLSRLSSDPPSPSKLSSFELGLAQSGSTTSPSLLVKALPRESVLPQPTAPCVIPVSPIFHLEAASPPLV